MRRANGEVTHFSAGAGVGFAVEVERSRGKSEKGSPIGLAVIPQVSQKIKHGGGTRGRDLAEGQTADGADLLFKLAGGAGFGGQVAGVVDARGEFVDPKAAIGKLKEFHREQADEI